MNVASPPAPSISPMTAAPLPASRPCTTTFAPCAANSIAMAFPIPDVDPVTSASSPLSRTRRRVGGAGVPDVAARGRCDRAGSPRSLGGSPDPPAAVARAGDVADVAKDV